MKRKSKRTLTPKLRFPEFRNDPEWEDKSLGEVAYVIAGQSPSGSNYNDQGIGKPFYQGKTDFGDIYIKSPTKWTTQVTKLAEEGDILMSVRAPVGALNISTEQICIGRGLASIRAKKNQWYLYYFLLRNEKSVIGNGGSVFDSISKNQIEKLSIWLPPDPVEQQKIAECLSSLDGLIAAEGRMLEALKAHKKGLMQQLFPQPGQTQPRLRFPEFRGKGEWRNELLGNICQPQQWPTISASDLCNTGFPVYGANGFIGYHSTFNHEHETVSVTCRGSTCGTVTLIPAKSYVTGNSMCLDGIDAQQVSYRFLYYFLKHRGFHDVISGSAQPQIVGTAIKRMRIALPDPAEQQKIAECLSSLDGLIAAEGRMLEALKAHKKGLMQQLFPAPEES